MAIKRREKFKRIQTTQVMLSDHNGIKLIQKQKDSWENPQALRD